MLSLIETGITVETKNRKMIFSFFQFFGLVCGAEVTD
jgi:hypothetical protein